jgi:ribonuclease HI
MAQDLAGDVVVHRLQLFTDGSCIGNGTDEATAGIGVYIAHGDPRNVSKAVSHEKKTNNTAELLAIIEALKIILVEAQVLLAKAQATVSRLPGAFSAKICSDSTYALDALTKYLQAYKKNGFRTRFGTPAHNSDLIKEAGDLIEIAEKQSIDLNFEKVTAHTNEHDGNHFADILALAAAQGFPGLPTCHDPCANRASEVLELYKQNQQHGKIGKKRKQLASKPSKRSRDSTPPRDALRKPAKVHCSVGAKDVSFSYNDWVCSINKSVCHQWPAFRDLVRGDIPEIELKGVHTRIVYLKPGGPMENEGEPRVRFETSLEAGLTTYKELPLSACLTAFETAAQV